MHIPFNRAPQLGTELSAISEALGGSRLSGDGVFGRKCQKWFEEYLGSAKALLTPSCTAALEMAALLLGVKPGDEIILPSYTFVSTANAFALRGATLVFVDVHPDTLNLDADLVEAAVTRRTKAIVPVHYAGVGCDMAAINSIAQKYGLFVIEDAAQGLMATMHDQPLGSFGHLAAFSFHETKNITSGGEGGLLVVNDPQFLEQAEIIREKGTNRSKFFRGVVDKYNWVDVGSSYLPSELQAAYLWAQLQGLKVITQDRIETWNWYYDRLKPLQKREKIVLPIVPDACVHNGHMFFIRTKTLEDRTALLSYLNERGVNAVFHYLPLHSSDPGEKFGRFHGIDNYTTKESERLIRLPLWFGMTNKMKEKVVDSLLQYYC